MRTRVQVELTDARSSGFVMKTIWRGRCKLSDEECRTGQGKVRFLRCLQLWASELRLKHTNPKPQRTTISWLRNEETAWCRGFKRAVFGPRFGALQCHPLRLKLWVHTPTFDVVDCSDKPSQGALPLAGRGRRIY